MSYDKHHSKHDRIFMVQTEYKFPQGEFYSHDCAIPVGPALKNEFSAIEEYVPNFIAPRMFFMDRKGEVIGEDGICYADPQIFKVFDHKFIYGTSDGALDSPNTIVIETKTFWSFRHTRVLRDQVF